MKWICVNRDGAYVGVVEADKANDAVVTCARMWSTSGVYDIDHVHPEDMRDAKCWHCEELRQARAKETHH